MHAGIMKENTSEEDTEGISEDEDSPEQGFVEAYAKDDEVVECAECGSACSEEKKVSQEIEGEKYAFCSKRCAQEFEESMGSTDMS